MSEGEEPLELAQQFWKAMCAKDGMKTINSMLSPDCYLKDGFGSDARGAHGTEAVSAKLTEINGKITGGAAAFETDIPFRVMRSKVQVRFLTTAKVGWITVKIGFALEFECGIIVKVVVMKNPGTGVFETDNTKEAPEQIPVVEDVAVKEEDVQLENREDAPTVTEEEMGGSEKNDASTEESEDQSYYFGKFLGRARPVRPTSAEDHHDPDEDTPPVPLAETLHPPFLTSKPPEIPPTVVVTVVGCMHLQSPLKRVIEREVNAYVSVQLKDMPVIQSTPVADPGRNPMFTSHNKFVFEAPPTGGTIMFTVYDKKTVGDDLVIAEVWVPLASLATTSSSNSAPTALSLPLQLLKQVSRFQKQKHRFSVSSGITEDTDDSEDKVGQLDVLVSKIDIMKWWALEELKARDEALDKKEAEEEAARQKELEDLAAKKAAVEEQKGIAGLLGKTLDSDINNCVRCEAEFTFFKRRHHCRFCLRVVCDDCSPDEALLDGQMHRCCKDCMENPPELAKTAKSSGQKHSDKVKANHISDDSLMSERPSAQTIGVTTTTTPSAGGDSEETTEEKSPVELQDVPLRVCRVNSTDPKWEPDDATEECRICKEEFSFFLRRRHHCRCCGRLVCGDCSPEEMMIEGLGERCCTDCIKKYQHW